MSNTPNAELAVTREHVHDVSCAFGNPQCSAFGEPEPPQPCWCGQVHDDNPMRGVGHAMLAALRLPRTVAGLDSLLRHWPWLYRHLGGPMSTNMSARLWLWRHRNHRYRDLTGTVWACSCGSSHKRIPPEKENC